MLRAYFDDSGTHTTSKIVVIGGLIGSCAQWDQFEKQWAEKLENPLPGKRRLKMFHLGACNARDDEFLGYSRAESDALIHDFRQIIIDAGLISAAFAVDRVAWDEFIVGPARDRFGDAISASVEQCLAECMRVAEPHAEGDKVAVWFDWGIKTDRLRMIAEKFTFPLGRPRIVSVNFAHVIDVLPLQGADIVATESYWHAIEWLKVGDAALPRAHLRHYTENTYYESLILDREKIAELSSLPVEEPSDE